MSKQTKFLSVNVKGLNSPQKRRKIFTKLLKAKADIIFIQETHIVEKDKKLLENLKLGKVFTASNKQKKNGVALYIKKQFEPELVFAAEDGRLLMVEISKEGEKILLVNIYAPNEAQGNFYSQLKNQLVQRPEQKICIMGDFNAIIDKEKDTSKETQHGRKKSRNMIPKLFLEMAEELNLIDLWRLRNPNRRDYTFYSNRHKSWSRIDNCWISAEVTYQAEDIEILPNIYADHNPILMTLGQRIRHSLWRLNTQLLREETFIKKIKNEMNIFFQMNKPQDTGMTTIWDTAKAYFRGYAIEFNTRRKKEKNKQYQTLITSLKNEEAKLKKAPTKKELLNKINILQHKINLLEQEEMEKKIKFTRQNFFENANKPGRWLAYRIKREREKTMITTLLNKQGKEIYKEKEIEEEICGFFKELYKKREGEEQRIANYWNNSPEWKLNTQQLEKMNEPITTEEISEAWKKQKNSKSPGPDGLPAEYYKTFEETLIPHFKKLIEDIQTKGEIPDSWKEAHISLIHKEGTDKRLVKNYRPISLLNVDYKIFTTILATRLKGILETIIHKDQTGFLSKRKLSSNIRTIIDILEYYELHPGKQMMLIFLDAEKAFDNVNWEFMFSLLERMDIQWCLAQRVPHTTMNSHNDAFFC